MWIGTILSLQHQSPSQGTQRPPCILCIAWGRSRRCNSRSCRKCRSLGRLCCCPSLECLAKWGMDIKRHWRIHSLATIIQRNWETIEALRSDEYLRYLFHRSHMPKPNKFLCPHSNRHCRHTLCTRSVTCRFGSFQWKSRIVCILLPRRRAHCLAPPDSYRCMRFAHNSQLYQYCTASIKVSCIVDNTYPIYLYISCIYSHYYPIFQKYDDFQD